MVVFSKRIWFWNKNIKGKNKNIVDALSHHANFLYASSNYELDLGNKILNAENFDKEYRNLKGKTKENERNQIKNKY